MRTSAGGVTMTPVIRWYRTVSVDLVMRVARSGPRVLGVASAILVVVATIAAPTPSVRQRSGRVDAIERREQGRHALHQRRFRDAVVDLEAAARSLPDDIDVHFLLGRAYWGEDRPYPISAAKAIAAFQRAVALDVTNDSPLGLEALQQLAVTCVRNERVVEARQVYTTLVARVTDRDLDDRYLTQIDEIDLDLGVYVPPPDARFNTRGEVLAPIGPRRMRTNRWFEKGRHTQDPVKEELFYRKATETDPAMHQGWLNGGVAVMNQGRYRDAIPLLQEAAKVWRLEHPTGPPYVRAHTWLMRCYLELGDLDGANTHWTLVSEAPFDNWVVLMRLRLLVAQGRATEALPALEAGAVDDPEHVELLYTLALARTGTRQYAAAADAMERALAAIPPNHPHFTHRRDDFAALLKALRNQRVPPQPEHAG